MACDTSQPYRSANDGHEKIAELLPLILVVVAARRQATPSPSPSANQAQRHICGELDADSCEAVIALVIAQVPDMARSAVAVADVRDEGATSHRGGDFIVLVSFQPVGLLDKFMDPPTWVVTQPPFRRPVQIDPWRGGPLPTHFLALLRSAGLAA